MLNKYVENGRIKYLTDINLTSCIITGLLKKKL